MTYMCSLNYKGFNIEVSKSRSYRAKYYVKIIENNKTISNYVPEWAIMRAYKHIDKTLFL